MESLSTCLSSYSTGEEARSLNEEHYTPAFASANHSPYYWLSACKLLCVFSNIAVKAFNKISIYNLLTNV